MQTHLRHPCIPNVREPRRHDCGMPFSPAQHTLPVCGGTPFPVPPRCARPYACPCHFLSRKRKSLLLLLTCSSLHHEPVWESGKYMRTTVTCPSLPPSQHAERGGGKAAPPLRVTEQSAYFIDHFHILCRTINAACQSLSGPAAGRKTPYAAEQRRSPSPCTSKPQHYFVLKIVGPIRRHKQAAAIEF